MKELLERCCGLDVHRDSVVASIIVGYGKTAREETRTFGTMTEDLEDLSRWLKEHTIEHVAIESTGIYWLPIFNVLGNRFSMTLANAMHVKNVPGRKTDVKDSQWLCRLLKNGLIQASFIPPEGIRELRNLTRYRKKLTNALTAEKNRLLRLLEAHNFKLASVFSDVYGKSAWNIILMIADGETDTDVLTVCIDHRVRAPRELIKKALKGIITKGSLGLLNIMIGSIQEIEERIATIDSLIAEALVPYTKEAENLKTIPGVSDIIAATAIAEIGTNMDQFKTPEQLASWTGLCPGNNESAGKKKVLESIKEISI